jgi:hypothetical protein
VCSAKSRHWLTGHYSGTDFAKIKNYSLTKFPSFFKGIIPWKLIGRKYPFFLKERNILFGETREYSFENVVHFKTDGFSWFWSRDCWIRFDWPTRKMTWSNTFFYTCSLPLFQCAFFMLISSFAYFELQINKLNFPLLRLVTSHSQLNYVTH